MAENSDKKNRLRLQLASDIHTEFYRNNQGRKVLQAIAKDTSDEVDAILIPGDLSTAQYLRYAFSVLCDLYENVVYTPGNHEYYGYTKKHVDDLLAEMFDKHSNLHILNRSVAEINGQRFIGTTLWYPKTSTAYDNRFHWSDFKAIQDSYEWIFGEFDNNKAFLEFEMKPDDVVLTHMLPCPEAIHSKWVGYKSNCYFLGDISDIISEIQPKLMCFGHTHNAMHFSIGKTDFYCNPLGYPGNEQNDFNYSLIIEI